MVKTKDVHTAEMAYVLHELIKVHTESPIHEILKAKQVISVDHLMALSFPIIDNWTYWFLLSAQFAIVFSALIHDLDHQGGSW
jgi:hypothetical protein